MIHELLFNLWNNSGNSINIDDNTSQHLFELPQFIHPAEAKLLQLILNIGGDYHKIMIFVNKVLNYNSNDVVIPETPPGLYLKTFCRGIRDTLKDYQNEIIDLEKIFLDHPQLSLTFILSKVKKYENLFKELKLIINRIETENFHGSLLFNLLNKYDNSSIEQIMQAAKIITKSMNIVFCQHLCNWIIFSDLIDPHNEFFICDGKTNDEDFLYDEEQTENSLKYKKSNIKRPPPVRKFFISWDMVPSFMNEELVENILFIGRIVWIIRNDPKKEENPQSYQTKLRRDIWEGKDIEYYKKIQKFENDTFNSVKFQNTIEECKIKLTKYLWSIMLEEGNLIENLKLMRDYYTLGRGELFQQFLMIANSHLNKITSHGVLDHINYLFNETARKIYGENDKTYLRFELDINGDIKTNFWQKIQLNFEIQWPLHIIFNPEVMTYYNNLFRFLLKLKKTQINLHKLWANHTLSKQKIDQRVWILRQNLMMLVNNLQFYMQVNVIEAEFTMLLKAVENANEFEDIIKIHHEFLINLLSKTFVLAIDETQKTKNNERIFHKKSLRHNAPGKIYNVINELLDLCDDFCLTANIWDPVLTKNDLEDLKILQERADTAIEVLLFTLYDLREKVDGQHLLQLLLQLDFNKYFGRKRNDLNLTLG